MMFISVDLFCVSILECDKIGVDGTGVYDKAAGPSDLKIILGSLISATARLTNLTFISNVS